MCSINTVRPTCTVFAATNDPRTTPLIEALEEEALAHFGLDAQPSPVAGFNTANAMDLLGSAYPEVQETILTSALVFTTPEPIVQYTETRFGIQHSESRPEMLEEMHDWLMAQVTDRLKQMNGVRRDPKAVGLYRCRVG